MRSGFEVIEGGRRQQPEPDRHRQAQAWMRSRSLRLSAYVAMALTVAFVIEQGSTLPMAAGNLVLKQVLCLAAAMAGFTLLLIGSLRWLRPAPQSLVFEKETKERTL